MFAFIKMCACFIETKGQSVDQNVHMVQMLEQVNCTWHFYSQRKTDFFIHVLKAFVKSMYNMAK